MELVSSLVSYCQQLHLTLTTMKKESIVCIFVATIITRKHQIIALYVDSMSCATYRKSFLYLLGPKWFPPVGRARCKCQSKERP